MSEVELPTETTTEAAAETTAETTDAAVKGPVTMRELLNLKGDYRVSGYTFNPWSGTLMFGVDEGIRSEDGFNVMRTLPGSFNVSQEDLLDFHALKCEPDETVVNAVKRFLLVKLNKALDTPVETTAAQ